MRAERYFMTRNDVLNHNEDLIAHAARRNLREIRKIDSLFLWPIDSPPVTLRLLRSSSVVHDALFFSSQ